MGIQGLIPFLEKASTPANVSEFSGKTVVIDAYCWLHKGAFSCADKLARGDACDTYVHYCMKFVNMLLSHRIKPILVFDGQKLPAKAGTEKKRRENRELNRKKAAELMRMDRGKEAQTYLRRCVDITHEMALQLIHACRSRNVDCIVAPYEADAQLAFFNVNDIADVIVTEDSDLLLFGAKRVLFKMDMQGNGLLIEQEKLHLAMDVRSENFSFDKFRYMCILSGCDYLPSLPGIGLVKARRFISRTADPDIHRAISRMSAHLNMPQLTITQEYRDSFMAADFMFKYQPVFDPFKRHVVPLNSFPDDDDDVCEQKFKELLAINGLSDDQICNLAYGNLDPFTLAKLDNWEPGVSSKGSKHSVSSGWNTVAVATHPSIWSENYVPNSWSTLKLKIEPPNALSIAHSPAASSKQNNSTDILKPSVKTTHENVEKAVKELKSLYACGTSTETNGKKDSESIQNQAISPDHLKKIHHNPWIKNTSKINSISPASKQNIGALSKFASLSKKSPSPIVESRSKVMSRYFNSNTTSSNENTSSSITSETQTLQATYSVQDSPKEINSPDSGSFCDRSPLKDQNVCDNEKLNASSSSPDLNKSISAIRKRLNPFAVKNPDKKYRTVFPLENNNATDPKKSVTTFKWSQKVESNFVYDVTARSGSTNEFKQPRKLETENDENASLDDESANLTPEQDNEDEGFCSPSVQNPSKSPISKKLKCRSIGLTKKPPLKQKSLLSMFAFKGPSKLKS